jgi:hypothetical protein
MWTGEGTLGYECPSPSLESFLKLTNNIFTMILLIIFLMQWKWLEIFRVWATIPE